MQLYPAIDIKNGQCVRLRQGRFEDVEVYSDVPAEVAGVWEAQGATYLHLVDLDGALAGHSVNEAVIREIIRHVQIPAELGGGIRTMQDIETVLGFGVHRVIIGTKAVQSTAFIEDAVRLFGTERIVVGVDAKDGWVATEGWEKASTVRAAELCGRMKEVGVKTIIYTDIARDGMLQGPNITQTKELSDATGMDIIASGGVSCMDDLRRLSDAGIHGAIIGKALYEKRISLREAVEEYERRK